MQLHPVLPNQGFPSHAGQVRSSLRIRIIQTLVCIIIMVTFLTDLGWVGLGWGGELQALDQLSATRNFSLAPKPLFTHCDFTSGYPREKNPSTVTCLQTSSLRQKGSYLPIFLFEMFPCASPQSASCFEERNEPNPSLHHTIDRPIIRDPGKEFDSNLDTGNTQQWNTQKASRLQICQRRASYE